MRGMFSRTTSCVHGASIPHQTLNALSSEELKEKQKMYQIIDGKKISQEIKDELKDKVAALKEQEKTVCLAVIQVGSDPASSVYVGNKKKACAYIGIDVAVI